MNDLRHTLLDIATTSIHGLNNTRGPNLWENVRDDRSAYGADFDFQVLDLPDYKVIYPDCNAALQWLYANCPEDCPRWGAKGFIVEAQYLDSILVRMRRDGLLSEDDYVENMLANERDQYAGEGL